MLDRLRQLPHNVTGTLRHAGSEVYDRSKRPAKIAVGVGIVGSVIGAIGGGSYVSFEKANEKQNAKLAASHVIGQYPTPGFAHDGLGPVESALADAKSDLIYIASRQDNSGN